MFMARMRTQAIGFGLWEMLVISLPGLALWLYIRAGSSYNPMLLQTTVPTRPTYQQSPRSQKRDKR